MKRMICALMAAVVLALTPLSACSRGEETSALPRTPEYLEPKSPEIPEAPEVPAPEIPEVPETPPPEPAPSVRQADYVEALVNGLNIRTGAGTAFPSLGQVQKGELLQYAGQSGNWYETRYCGKRAYVSADPRYTAIAKLNTGEEKTESVIEHGLALLGTPYVYGATRLHDGKGNFLRGFSSDAFDCSSLMQYIFYFGAGELLDVTTRTQIKQGEKIEKEDIARGDLLFFTNASRYGNTGIERVGHVALYLGGNYILHTASDFAKVEQITPLRRSYFLEARRVL